MFVEIIVDGNVLWLGIDTDETTVGMFPAVRLSVVPLHRLVHEHVAGVVAGDVHEPLGTICDHAKSNRILIGGPADR